MALIKRLTEFSQQKEKWQGILPGAHRAHCGPHSGTKNTSMKKSAQRRIALFPPLDVAHLMDTSVDCRTQEEIENILPWVKMIGMMYPYPPPCSSVMVTCVMPAMAAPFIAPTAAPADNDMQVKTFKMLQEILLHVNPSLTQLWTTMLGSPLFL